MLWLALFGLSRSVLLGSKPRKRHRRMVFGATLSCVLFRVNDVVSLRRRHWDADRYSYHLTLVGTFSSGSANLVRSTKLTRVMQ
jgi:hypothetical protein